MSGSKRRIQPKLETTMDSRIACEVCRQGFLGEIADRKTQRLERRVVEFETRVVIGEYDGPVDRE